MGLDLTSAGGTTDRSVFTTATPHLLLMLTL